MNFKFENTPKISKELILSKVDPERIFEHYLGISVKKGLFCSSPVIRTDKTPTASFYKNAAGVLFYNDFAGPSFDCFGCVQHIFQCNFYNALKIIANDFGIIELSNVVKNQPKIEYTDTILTETIKATIAVEIKDFTEKELKWWNSFGVTVQQLKKYKVYSIKHVFLNGHYHTSSSDSSPIYGYYGGTSLDDEGLWRLYMPTKTKFRFLSNWESSFIQGSKQLPKYGDFVVVTKSMKDLMVLDSFGIPSCAPCSENLFLTKEQYEKLQRRFKTIYLLYDYDRAGIKSANKIRKKFNVQVLLMPKKSKCKDFTDYYKKYGQIKTTKLVEEWLEKRKK